MTIPIQNFNPNQSFTLVCTTDGTAQAVTQPTIPGGQPYTCLRIFNGAAGTAKIGWGTTSAAAVTVSSSGVAVGPSQTSIFSMGSGYNFISALLTSGTGNVFASVGEGS